MRELSKCLDNMTLSKVGSLLKEVPFIDKTQIKVIAKRQAENITAPPINILQQRKTKIYKKKIDSNNT